MRGQSGNEEEVGCQTRNNANLPHVVLVSCGKTGCLLGSKSEKSEKEGNSRKKREIDGKAVKTSSRAAVVLVGRLGLQGQANFTGSRSLVWRFSAAFAGVVGSVTNIDISSIHIS